MKGNEMVKEKDIESEPDFVWLVFGIILIFHSLALFAIFDIFELGWTLFLLNIIMLVLGGIAFYNEAEKILEKIKFF
ncbi:MAG: hypothetical protein HYW34_00695 [Candidatus Brennerbacteria bacterium]|nr:hypothetical protein [Candidatus Brennerbacteria bacterium]